MDTMTPVLDEIASLKHMLNHEDIAMTKRERRDREKRLWQLERSSHYCDARLQEEKIKSRASTLSESSREES